MLRVKYMIGASVVCVSAITDIGVNVNDGVWNIKLMYKKISDLSFSEVIGFQWQFNDFRYELENLEPETEYMMYVVVNDRYENLQSPILTIKTESLGNCSYAILPSIKDSRGDFTSNVETMANEFVNKLNAIGLKYGQINFRYNAGAGTAQANYHGEIQFGYNYASHPDWSYSGSTIIHEARHYFGDMQYSSLNHSRRFYQGTVYIHNICGGRWGSLGEIAKYSVDDVHKFIMGSDIAFVNLNGDHSSAYNGSSLTDMFMCRAINLEKVWIVSTPEEAANELIGVVETPTILVGNSAHNTEEFYAGMQGSLWEYLKGNESHFFWPREHYLSDIKLGSGITEIGNAAFSGSNITKFPEHDSTITALGDHAFQGVHFDNPNLVLEEGLLSIGEYCFFNTNLESLDVPVSCKSIGYRSFYNVDTFKKLIVRSSEYMALPLSITWDGTLYVQPYLVDEYKKSYISYQVLPIED